MGGRKEQEKGKKDGEFCLFISLPENISFEILSYRYLYPLSVKKVACLVGFVAPTLLICAMTSRWHNGAPVFQGNNLVSGCCLSEQLMHLAGNFIHLFKLAFCFCIFLFWGHRSEKGPALRGSLTPVHLKQRSKCSLQMRTLSCELPPPTQMLKSHHLFLQKNQRRRAIQADNVL